MVSGMVVDTINSSPLPEADSNSARPIGGDKASQLEQGTTDRIWPVVVGTVQENRDIDSQQWFAGS